MRTGIKKASGMRLCIKHRVRGLEVGWTKRGGIASRVSLSCKVLTHSGLIGQQIFWIVQRKDERNIGAGRSFVER